MFKNIWINWILHSVIVLSQVPISVHYDHGISKSDLLQALEAVCKDPWFPQICITKDDMRVHFLTINLEFFSWSLLWPLNFQGFDSVMVDGSHLTLRENILYTKSISSLAHAKGLLVEAELGRLSGSEDGLTVEEYEARFTDVSQVRFFFHNNVNWVAFYHDTCAYF